MLYISPTLSESTLMIMSEGTSVRWSDHTERFIPAGILVEMPNGDFVSLDALIECWTEVNGLEDD